jgi:hypothetical protein
MGGRPRRERGRRRHTICLAKCAGDQPAGIKGPHRLVTCSLCCAINPAHPSRDAATPIGMCLEPGTRPLGALCPWRAVRLCSIHLGDLPPAQTPSARAVPLQRRYVSRCCLTWASSAVQHTKKEEKKSIWRTASVIATSVLQIIVGSATHRQRVYSARGLAQGVAMGLLSGFREDGALFIRACARAHVRCLEERGDQRSSAAFGPTNRLKAASTAAFIQHPRAAAAAAAATAPTTVAAPLSPPPRAHADNHWPPPTHRRVERANCGNGHCGGISSAPVGGLPLDSQVGWRPGGPVRCCFGNSSDTSVCAPASATPR